MEGLLPLGFWNSLRKGLPDATFEDFTQAYTDFMLVKSVEEIALLRFAAGVAERVCRVMADVTRPGVSEAEIYAEMMRETYRWGCDARYPFLSLQSGSANIGWGAAGCCAPGARRVSAATWCSRDPYVVWRTGSAGADVGGARPDRCRQPEMRNRRAQPRAGLKAVKPGATFAGWCAMAAPIKAAGCWSKTPLAHTLSSAAQVSRA
jgi:hypothetical protein